MDTGLPHIGLAKLIIYLCGLRDCQHVFLQPVAALPSSLALVAHIPTPLVHYVGAYRHSTQAPGVWRRPLTGWPRARRRQQRGPGQLICPCGSSKSVPHCVSLIRADQGLLWGSPGLENKGKQGRCTDVRFLGGSRREGEGFTRISESNRRRNGSLGRREPGIDGAPRVNSFTFSLKECGCRKDIRFDPRDETTKTTIVQLFLVSALT